METTLSKSKDECRQINHNPENLPYNQSGFFTEALHLLGIIHQTGRAGLPKDYKKQNF